MGPEIVLMGDSIDYYYENDHFDLSAKAGSNMTLAEHIVSLYCEPQCYDTI